MGKLSDIIKNPGVIGQYVRGMVSAKRDTKNCYNLTFVKEANGGWYIDLPNWKGSHANLAMVAGSDLLLDHLHRENDKVEVEVVKSDIPLDDMDGYFVCEQLEMSMFGGATYNVCGLEGFERPIWICPVTLFVLGEYPKYIYICQTK